MYRQEDAIFMKPPELKKEQEHFTARIALEIHAAGIDLKIIKTYHGAMIDQQPKRLATIPERQP
jgi:hypothetical protein